MRRARACAPVAAALLAGCGHDQADRPSRAPEASTRPATAARPARGAALCRQLTVRVTGRVDDDDATELSGLAVSRSRPGVLWALNDSGNPAQLFALATDGRVLAAPAVTAAENDDWEDVAAGPAPGPGDALYLADIGDNDAERPDIAVYRVAEPDVAGGSVSATAPAQRLELRYPDGAHDAETLLVDPVDGALAVVTKEISGRSRVYVVDRPAFGATATLRHAATLSLGVGQAATAGDVSADGRVIAVRTLDRVFVWRRPRGLSLARAMRRSPCVAPRSLGDEGQGETLALTRAGDAFFTVPEGDEPAVRRYEARPGSRADG